MRPGQNTSIIDGDLSSVTDDETSCFLSGATTGVISWLLALGTLYLIYGHHLLFFFLYTWPFFLVSMPVAAIIGIAWRISLDGKLLYSICMTFFTVELMFGLLFLWLWG